MGAQKGHIEQEPHHQESSKHSNQESPSQLTTPPILTTATIGTTPQPTPSPEILDLDDLDLDTLALNRETLLHSKNSASCVHTSMPFRTFVLAFVAVYMKM